MDLRPGRAPRLWTEGDADAAGLATGADVGGAAAGAAWGSGTAGSISETMRGGKSGDGDAVAEAETEAEAGAELVLETGAGLFFLLAFSVAFEVLAILSASPSAVASPVVATEAGAGTAGDGSSTPAEVVIVLLSALAADSMDGCDGVNWTEAIEQMPAQNGKPRESFPI